MNFAVGTQIKRAEKISQVGPDQNEKDIQGCSQGWTVFKTVFLLKPGVQDGGFEYNKRYTWSF